MPVIVFPSIFGLPFSVATPNAVVAGPVRLDIDNQKLYIAGQEVSVTPPDSSRVVRLQAGTESAPLADGPDLFFGQFALEWLSMSLTFPSGSFTLTDPQQIALTGQVRWKAVEHIGFNRDVRFRMSWTGSSIALTLVPGPGDLLWGVDGMRVAIADNTAATITDLSSATPPAILVSLRSGLTVSEDDLINEHLEIVLEVLNSLLEQSQLETLLGLNAGELLTGADELTDTARNKIRSLIKSFSFSRKIPLEAGSSTPGDDDKGWSFSFAIDLTETMGRLEWDVGNSGVPVKLAVEPGTLLMQVSGEAVEIDKLAWSLQFRDCSFGFPEVAGLELPVLRGTLILATDDVTDINNLDFRFIPSAVQTMPLPRILEFLLGYLEWVPGFAGLEDLVELLGQSQTDVQWLEYFINALGTTVSEGDLANLIELARATTDLDDEAIFSLLLRAITQLSDADLADQWLAAAWRVLARLLGTTDLDAKLAALLRIVFQASGADFTRIARVLFEQADNIGLDCGDLMIRAARLVQGNIPSDTVLAIWPRLLAAAAEGLRDTPALRRNLLDGLFTLLQLDDSDDLRSLKVAIPGYSQPRNVLSGAMDHDMPLIDALLGQSLTALGIAVPGLLPLPGSEGIPGLTSLLKQRLQQLLNDIVVDAATLLGLLRDLIDMIQNPADSAAARRQALMREWALMNLVSKFPPLGIVLLPAAIVYVLTKEGPFAPLLKYVGMDLSGFGDTTDIRVKHLDRIAGDMMGEGKKYLIVSDLHRDADSDDLGKLRFGSIDHFRDNRRLYREMLRYAWDNGYTVIENGDCEELWYIREFNEYASPGQKLKHILQDNRAIYADLWKLHSAGRYYRVTGNHDSYVRGLMDAVADDDWDGLQAEWRAVAESWRDDVAAGRVAEQYLMFEDERDYMTFSSPSGDFVLYDFIVIHGVKTMDEHGITDFLSDDPKKMATGKLGMDAADYRDNKPMIICHGHQFDFWNCDENAILGKLISNLAGVPADKLTDPFLDLKGIAMAGNPLIDFRKIISRTPILNNWQASNTATEMAHQLQHRDDTDRLPVDDIMYQETLAMFIATFFMQVDQDETVFHVPLIDNSSIPADVRNCIRKRLNHFCVGHTHYPQSQPYWVIPEQLMGPLVPAIGATVDAISAMIPGFSYDSGDGALRLPLKTRYFNTGVASWNKGVVWGIDIQPRQYDDNAYDDVDYTEQFDGGPEGYRGEKQARSVYFTDNTRGPEYMDWELDELDPEIRAQMKALLDTQDIRELVANMVNDVDRWGSERFNDIMRYLVNLSSMGIPQSALFNLDADRFDELFSGISDLIDDIDIGGGDDRKHSLQQQIEGLFGMFCVFLLSLVQRACGLGPGGSRVTAPAKDFSFRIPLGEAKGAIGQIESWARQLVPGQSGEFASICFQTINHLPMLGRDPTLFADGLQFFQRRSPLLSAGVALLSMLPRGGQTIAIGNLELTADTVIDGNDLVVTVSVEEV